MRLSRLEVAGFRNLSGTIDFPHALTLLVGGNNTGKSNVIDALRIISPPRAGMHLNRWITTDDFHHNPSGQRATDTFDIAATYVELSDDERGRMLTCLA